MQALPPLDLEADLVVATPSGDFRLTSRAHDLTVHAPGLRSAFRALRQIRRRSSNLSSLQRFWQLADVTVTVAVGRVRLARLAPESGWLSRWLGLPPCRVTLFPRG